MRLLRALLTAGLLVAGLAVGGSGLMRFEAEPAGPSVDAPRDSAPARIRVEVLNAGGVAGAARAATAELRDRGFDVVYFGNAEQFGRDSTMVLDRVGTLKRARAVADAMGVRRVSTEPDSNLYVDVSVLLGTDWTVPVEPIEEPEPDRPWWDLSRLLNRASSSR